VDWADGLRMHLHAQHSRPVLPWWASLPQLNASCRYRASSCSVYGNAAVLPEDAEALLIPAAAPLTGIGREVRAGDALRGAWFGGESGRSPSRLRPHLAVRALLCTRR